MSNTVSMHQLSDKVARYRVNCTLLTPVQGVKIGNVQCLWWDLKSLTRQIIY